MNKMMKILSCFFILVLMILSTSLVYAGWSATFFAQGEDLALEEDSYPVSKYQSIIGVDVTALEAEPPPAPPAYSVMMELLDINTLVPLAKEIRQEGETSYMWILNLDPNGSEDDTGTSRTATISWDPAEFSTGEYEMRAGSDGLGPVIVADMKTTTFYEVFGASAVNFTIHLTTESFNLDIDGNGVADALSDGVLIVRYLFGFRGAVLIDGAADTVDGTRTTAPEIETYLAVGVSTLRLDIDGNGVADALSDGVLIVRYLFGFRGAVLIDGVVDTVDGTRTTAPEIEAYIQSIL